MYKEYFGLSDYPFNLTPDPKYLVVTPGYNEILAGLYYGIEMAKGLTVVTGEVGTGKTTALRWIIRRLQTGVLASYIINPHLSIEEFYYHLTDMLGLKHWSNKSEMLTQLGNLLEQRHQRAMRTILIVDEAHQLSDEVLEEIRLLLNFESDSAKHLQVVLAGQPELTEKLRQPNLRQLKQRVALRCTMPILNSLEDVERYITERLKIAEAKQTDIFSNEAIELIYQCSEGIPRQVSNLCDNALLSAYAAGRTTIGREIVAEVAENLDMLPDPSGLLASERMAEASTGVLTRQAKEELLDDNQQNLEIGTKRAKRGRVKDRDFNGLREV